MLPPSGMNGKVAIGTFKDIAPAIMQPTSLPRALVEVDDIAAAVAFLASDAAGGYHGACVTLDHGMSS